MKIIAWVEKLEGRQGHFPSYRGQGHDAANDKTDCRKEVRILCQSAPRRHVPRLLPGLQTHLRVRYRSCWKALRRSRARMGVKRYRIFKCPYHDTWLQPERKPFPHWQCKSRTASKLCSFARVAKMRTRVELKIFRHA